MRIENPTFALTSGGGEMAPSTPDVTRTVAARDESSATSPPPPPPSAGHKHGLLDGSPANQVYYVRGWKISMSRVWQALAAIFLALFLIMVVAYASRSSGGETRPIIVTPPPTARPQVSERRECQQADCVYQAADMMQVMNLSVDPCHDFYSYACGNFGNLAPDSRNSRSIYTTADWLREKNDQQVVSMLLEEPDTVASTSAVWKLKTLYTSCLNDYENMRLAGQKMVRIINEIGGLDLFGTWSEDLWNFNGTFRKVHDEHWTDAMMNFFWVRNPRLPNKNLLRITKSGIGIPYNSAYLNPDQVVYRKMMTAYRLTMTTIMGMLVRDSGVNVTALNTTCGDRCLAQFTDDVIDIETKLANISVARFPRFAVFGRRRRRRQTRLHRLLGLGLRPPLSRRITLDELTQRAPQIDWMSLFEDLMGEGIVSKETMVEIPRNSYIEKLGEIISTESKRALQHYLVWCLVRRHLMGMSVDYVFQKLRLDEVIRRARKPQSREEYCQAILGKHMAEAMGKLFAKNHIGMDTLAQAANFTRSMVEAFSTSFDVWMTGSVQYQADSILTNTTFHYGFPKWILSDLELDMYFRPLSIIQDNFFQNMKNIDLFKRIVLRNKLRYGNNKQRWTIKATHARILSSNSGGYLAVPAGMLRPPIFSPSLPHYVNTAALGSLVGQHLSLFTVTNNESRLLDRVWWDSSTNERYQPYRSCLLDLYRNHTLSPSRIYSNLPRMQLRPDRMAVSIVNRHYALDVAFAEHSRYSRQTGRPVRLPGLGHETSDQTFFLAFAQARCSTKRSASTNFLLHRLAGIIPVELEINSAVYNHHKFREAYKCAALPAEYSHASCVITPNGKRPLT